MKILVHQGYRPIGWGLFFCMWCVVYGSQSHAQVPHLWIWQDEHGRKVYSDRAPPNHIPTQRIIQEPAQTHQSGSPRSTLAPTASTVNAVLSPRETVKRDNCLAAQSSLALLRSHNNWVIEDGDGTRLAMDQGMRRAETARLRQIMRDNCTYAR